MRRFPGKPRDSNTGGDAASQTDRTIQVEAKESRTVRKRRSSEVREEEQFAGEGTRHSRSTEEN